MITEDSSVSRSLTCFLSSAFRDSDSAEHVRQILISLDVTVRTADDLPSGIDVASSIVDAVLSADFVCIVLATDLNNPAVWYEAGIAAGSRRPLLVVTEGKTIDQLPFNLFSAPLIRYQPGLIQALRDSLTAYIRQVQPIAAQLKINWSQIPAAPAPPLAAASGTSVESTEMATQARIAEHLAEQGILTATYARVGPDKRVDALISFPTLGDEFNTVVLEVKRYRSNENRDIDQVIDYMDAAEARLAVLAYANQEINLKPQTRISGPIGIMLVSADELLSWDYQRIIKELTRLRNRVVHSD
jgi:hypothetical protein